ncbi:FecR domain-containing protein [Echinicola sp. CAU 1574]|uniref:FecR domain-containing protein n=1 Tax=Echinicola arenosa TaxID=2774144 RepID=A0ABR9AJZ8_9BACT|nr:FecR family protein [Echinicola arenosa]MBD8489150.1 FecR domain-containing protein [Echinicola arenosa]
MQKDNLYHFYAKLIHKELRNQLDPQERKLLEEWLSKDLKNKEFYDKITSSGFIDQQIFKLENIDSDKSFKNLESKILSRRGETLTRQLWIKKTASVAAVLALMFLGWSLAHFTGLLDSSGNNMNINQVADVPPGKEKATLVLPDGNRIHLEDLIEGKKHTHEGLQVTKNKDFVAISLDSKPSLKSDKYSKVIVPTGGKYTVELHDGTKVWLNSASTLSFPSEFKQGRREVTLSGEAYFEVAHNPKSPFIVEANGTQVKVLGTHFNIKAYQNENVTKTTLLEGKVEVAYNGRKKVLVPGYQAMSNEDLEVSMGSLEEAIAWKEGYFLFQSTRLDEVLRQLERWYNIKVDAKGQIPTRHFNASIDMDTKLSKVIEVLELSGEIDFEFKNGILYVTEKN